MRKSPGPREGRGPRAKGQTAAVSWPQDAGVLLGEGGNDENTLGFGVRGPEAGGAFTRVRNRGEEMERGKGKEGTTARRFGPSVGGRRGARGPECGG